MTTTKTTEVSVIRKKLSEDYKERENFLESYCRQSSSDTLKDDFGNKRLSRQSSSDALKEDIGKRTIDNKRKGKLLAALKAIDTTDE